MLGHYDAGFTLCIHATRQAQNAAAVTLGEIMALAK